MMLLFVLHKMWLTPLSIFYIGVSLAPTYHFDINTENIINLNSTLKFGNYIIALCNFYLYAELTSLFYYLYYTSLLLNYKDSLCDTKITNYTILCDMQLTRRPLVDMVVSVSSSVYICTDISTSYGSSHSLVCVPVP